MASVTLLSVPLLRVTLLSVPLLRVTLLSVTMMVPAAVDREPPRRTVG